MSDFAVFLDEKEEKSSQFAYCLWQCHDEHKLVILHDQIIFPKLNKDVHVLISRYIIFL